MINLFADGAPFPLLILEDADAVACLAIGLLVPVGMLLGGRWIIRRLMRNTMRNESE